MKSIKNLIKWAIAFGERFLFDGVPLIDIIRFFAKEIVKPDINVRASAIAFNFMLALFPFCLFLFTLIPYLPIQDFESTFVSYFKDVLPAQAYQTFESTLKDIASSKKGGLLSLGFIMTLYFASNAIHTLIATFNKDHESFTHRGFFKQRAVALWILLITCGFVLIATLLITFGQLGLYKAFVYFQIDNNWNQVLFNLLRWILTVLLLYFAFATLYYFGPATQKKYRFISVGSTFATLFFVITSYFFSYYVNHFGNYNKIYGSIGTLIMIMGWMQLNALVVIAGFELNASIVVNKYFSKKRKIDVA